MMDRAQMRFINGMGSLMRPGLRAFFSQAMTQERRRYGFVLERQCSLAKHYASFHEVALAALHPSVDKWREVAATREYLPQSVEDMFASRLRVNSRLGSSRGSHAIRDVTPTASIIRARNPPAGHPAAISSSEIGSLRIERFKSSISESR